MKSKLKNKHLPYPLASVNNNKVVCKEGFEERVTSTHLSRVPKTVCAKESANNPDEDKAPISKREQRGIPLQTGRDLDRDTFESHQFGVWSDAPLCHLESTAPSARP